MALLGKQEVRVIYGNRADAYQVHGVAAPKINSHVGTAIAGDDEAAGIRDQYGRDIQGIRTIGKVGNGIDAVAGAALAWIAAVSGHTEASIGTILARYQVRTRLQAARAFALRLAVETEERPGNANP